MDIHPCTIEEYIRSWPRYSSGTSSATEVLEIIRQTGIKELLRRTSPWRKIIRSGTEVYRDMQTQEQGQVRRLLLACNEQLLRLLEGPGAVNDDSEQRQPLIVIDAPPGSGKTTVAIPEALLRLRYAVRDCPWPLATLYRERRENVVESEEWLNMLDEEDLKSA